MVHALLCLVNVIQICLCPDSSTRLQLERGDFWKSAFRDNKWENSPTFVVSTLERGFFTLHGAIPWRARRKNQVDNFGLLLWQLTQPLQWRCGQLCQSRDFQPPVPPSPPPHTHTLPSNPSKFPVSNTRNKISCTRIPILLWRSTCGRCHRWLTDSHWKPEQICLVHYYGTTHLEGLCDSQVVPKTALGGLLIVVEKVTVFSLSHKPRALGGIQYSSVVAERV